MTTIRPADFDHAAQHAVGGADPLTPAQIGALAANAAVLSAPPMVPSIEAYGHSQVAGTGASDPRYDYMGHLASMLGKPTINRVAQYGGGVAGTIANGAVGKLMANGLPTDLTAGPYKTRGGLKLCSIGFNDAVPFQAPANGDLLVEAALRAAFSRLLAARVILARTAAGALNTAELTFSSGWGNSAEAVYSPPNGFAYHLTSGAYVELATGSAYRGEAITLLLPLNAFSDSTVTLTADGGATLATVDTGDFQTVIAGAGVTGALVGLRIPAGVLADGNRVVRATFTGILGGEGAYMGGFIIEGNAPPPLILPNIPQLYSDPGGDFNDNALWQNARVANVAAGFPSAVQVDITSAMSPNGNSADDKYWSVAFPGHANNLGFERVAKVLYDAARPLLTPDVVSKMDAPGVITADDAYKLTTPATAFGKAYARDEGQPGVCGWSPYSFLSTTAGWVANLTYYSRFVPSRDRTITKCGYALAALAAAGGGGCEIGICDSTLAVLGRTGSAVRNEAGAGIKIVSLLAPVNLVAGQTYYTAYSFGTVTATPPNLNYAGLGGTYSVVDAIVSATTPGERFIGYRTSAGTGAAPTIPGAGAFTAATTICPAVVWLE
jgi:hypothetical protein